MQLPVAYLCRKYESEGLGGVAHIAGRWARVLWGWRQHQALLSTFRSGPARSVYARFPRLPFRYTSPYLSRLFSWDERLLALQWHYEWLNRSLSSEFVDEALRETLSIWELASPVGLLSIRVKTLCTQTDHHEGDLTFALLSGDKILCELSFSIIPASLLRQRQSFSGSPETVLFVGRVQGATGCFDQIREASRQCHDVAPPDLLMCAVHGFAQALGIGWVAGVGQVDSISNGLMAHALSTFNYDVFWTRYLGEAMPSGGTLMAVPFADKPIASVATRHRKRTLLKRAFKGGVTRLVAQRIRGYARQI